MGWSRCKVECLTKRRLEGRVEGRHAQTTSTSTNTDDLKDDIHTKPRHQLVQVSSLHRKKKSTFCRNFPSKHLELSKLFHTFATPKDIRQAHSSTHSSTQSSVFRDDEIFIKQRASSKWQKTRDERLEHSEASTWTSIEKSLKQWLPRRASSSTSIDGMS